MFLEHTLVKSIRYSKYYSAKFKFQNPTKPCKNSILVNMQIWSETVATPFRESCNSNRALLSLKQPPSHSSVVVVLIKPTKVGQQAFGPQMTEPLIFLLSGQHRFWECREEKKLYDDVDGQSYDHVVEQGARNPRIPAHSCVWERYQKPSLCNEYI